jgi:DNA-binding transcriptional regulator YhcF (GntR family)
MLSLTVSQTSDQPLVDQIVAGIRRQIDDRHLRPGTKLPSIRNFAEVYDVSRFTVVEAYDRLVAMGYVQSRRGSGFYTAAPRPARGEGAHPAPSDSHKRNEELVWLIRRLLEANENTLLAGGPWLPNSWLDEAGIRQCSRERMAPSCWNTETPSVTCRCANNSRSCWLDSESPPIQARFC